jgi:tetratricopeptide (TPR) repeat protein
VFSPKKEVMVAKIAACTARIQSGEEDKHDSARAFYNRAWGYMAKGEWIRAIKDLDQAIKLEPEFANAYETRGIAYGLLRQRARAIQDYDKAIALKPELAELYVNRANDYVALGQFGLAFRDFNRAIALKPDSSEAYNNRGITFGHQERADRAIQDYGKSIALHPNFSAFNNRGVAYFHLGKYARAIEDSNEAIALNPTFAEVYSNRGLSYRAIGDASHADQDYQKAIALLPKDTSGLNARAWMRALWGRDLNTALAECNTALQKTPNDGTLRGVCGFVRYRIGDTAGAIEAYDAAIAAQPDQPLVRYLRGVAKLKAKLPGGQSDIAAAEALDPSVAQTLASFGVKS